MMTFGVIAEGATDQAVIKSILLGFFQGTTEELVIRPIQPPSPTPSEPAPQGNWQHVFHCLKRGDAQEVLDYTHFLVVHIDTDVQEEPGFDVPRRDGTRELTVFERVARVIDRLIRDIGPAFVQEEGHRILFAIAVDSIECWLLPLLYNNKKAEKTTGCEGAANAELRKKNRKGLSAGDTKFRHAYTEASRDYRTRKILLNKAKKNPSLEIFLQRLEALQSRLTANDPGASPGDGKASPEGENPPESIASE